jgi:MurNAc alpha-1-phosphate uridylyltransferase
MNALILAAGRGERMRPLTDHTPKPLLPVRGKPLIEWHLQALARAGVLEVVINTAWLEEQFPAALGDGARWGLRIRYSQEGRDHGGALETAGGMKKALPWLGERFWVVSGDVFLPGFAFDARAADMMDRRGALAQLWLVDNPPHHPRGDFGIRDGLAVNDAEPRYTWASVGLFRAAFVETLMADLPIGTKAPLRPYFEAAIARSALGAEHYAGPWTDVGTVERLQTLQG